MQFLHQQSTGASGDAGVPDEWLACLYFQWGSHAFFGDAMIFLAWD